MGFNQSYQFWLAVLIEFGLCEVVVGDFSLFSKLNFEAK